MSHATDEWKDEKERGGGLEGLHSAANNQLSTVLKQGLARRQMCHQRQLTVCSVPPIKLGVEKQERALIARCGSSHATRCLELECSR